VAYTTKQRKNSIARWEHLEAAWHGHGKPV
jgi:hypothetical protein